MQGEFWMQIVLPQVEYVVPKIKIISGMIFHQQTRQTKVFIHPACQLTKGKIQADSSVEYAQPELGKTIQLGLTEEK